MNRFDKASNSRQRSMPNTEGHFTVASMISADTGLRSLAMAAAPSRTASKGMLPPPAVGSRILKSLGDAFSVVCNHS